jgi:Rrf2 family protein
MLRFSKRIEYAFFALQHMAEKAEMKSSVKEIAERFGVSFELMAKVMQQLNRHGLISSVQGSTGGYMLARAASAITLKDVVHAIEGRKMALMECQSKQDHECYAEKSCTIRSPLVRLQLMFEQTLDAVTVADLSPQPEPVVRLELN